MKTIAEYEKATGLVCQPEEYACLRGTRIVYSNTKRFVEDYGLDTTDRSVIDDHIIRAALLRAGSVISQPHTIENVLHSTPSNVRSYLKGYRPPLYGRAALFNIKDHGESRFEGLLDIKGCGVRNGIKPELEKNQTGVLFLHEALTELINSVLLNRLFTRDGVELSTVPFYAITHTGIRAKVDWANASIPCACLIRRAVVRPPGNNELPCSGSELEMIHHEIEHYFLSRGMTTTGSAITFAREDSTYVARRNGQKLTQLTEEIIYMHLYSMGLYPPQIFNFANVQIARGASRDPLKACLIDLGHIRACNDLPGHLSIFVNDRPLSWGLTTLKSGPHWPSRSKHKPIDHSVYGPQLLLSGGIDKRIHEWLQPTDVFPKIIDGVTKEAFRLAMLVDLEELTPGQLMNEIEQLVDRACPR